MANDHNGMDRRDFLKWTLAATGGVGMGIAEQASASPGNWPWDHDAVYLFSDPHIDEDEGLKVRGQWMAENLCQALRRMSEVLRAKTLDIEKLEGQARRQADADRWFAWLFINGDCARDQGRNGDYRRLKAIVEEIGNPAFGPTVYLPGNHDHRGNMEDAELFRKRAGVHDVTGKQDHRYCRHCKTKSTDWYLLDSLRLTDEIAGDLGRSQLNWLAEQLDKNQTNRPAFILVHHQPEDPKDPDDDGYGLADGNALIDLLRDRKRVKAIFHGHKHAWGVREANGIHIVGLPSTAYAFRDGEPLGYVEARPRADHIELTRRCLDAKNPAEGEVHRLGFR